MIPAPFEYVRATSVDETLAALAEHGDESKLLAGGHSLLPLMKLRFAAPAVLVDIGRIDELSYVREDGDVLRIGALTRHHDIERDPTLAQHAPILPYATSHVGDPQVRHRGTIGGSIAHGDPASDLPAVLLALDASLVIVGPAGQREVRATDFFLGFLETAIGADEMLVEITIPKATDCSWSFQKFTRRAQDWAIVGAAAVRAGDDIRVGLVNMHSIPVRARAVEAAISSGATAAEASALAADGVEPSADLHATVDYRKHLARVLVGRALVEAS